MVITTSQCVPLMTDNIASRVEKHDNHLSPCSAVLQSANLETKTWQLHSETAL